MAPRSLECRKLIFRPDRREAISDSDGSYAIGNGEPATASVSNTNGVFSTTAATTGAGTVDISNPSGANPLKPDKAFTLTFTPPDANGRGTMTLTPATGTGTGTTLIYWMSSSTSILAIDAINTNTNTQIMRFQQ